MIDPQVAFDKLAQFQTSDELAAFFQSEGIRSFPGAARACAISDWMRTTTGVHVTTLPGGIFIGDHVREQVKFDTNDVMKQFIYRFDKCLYPQLLHEGHVRHQDRDECGKCGAWCDAGSPCPADDES